jgi:hypothetical protein
MNDQFAMFIPSSKAILMNVPVPDWRMIRFHSNEFGPSRQIVKLDQNNFKDNAAVLWAFASCDRPACLVLRFSDAKVFLDPVSGLKVTSDLP